MLAITKIKSRDRGFTSRVQNIMWQLFLKGHGHWYVLKECLKKVTISSYLNWLDFIINLLRTNSLKLEGIKKLWGKEGYLPKKESKTGDESGALPIPQESIMENVDQAITKKDQSQVLTQSKEEKEKQLLASSLFVGLGSESTVNLVSNRFYSSKNRCCLFAKKTGSIKAPGRHLFVWWEVASPVLTHHHFPAPEPLMTHLLYSWKRKCSWLNLSQVFSVTQSVDKGQAPNSYRYDHGGSHPCGWMGQFSKGRGMMIIIQQCWSIFVKSTPQNCIT